MRRNSETHQEVNVTTLEVILSVAAYSLDGGLDGLDGRLGVFGRITRMTTGLLGGHWSEAAKRRRPDRWQRLIHRRREVVFWRAIILLVVAGETEGRDSKTRHVVSCRGRV